MHPKNKFACQECFFDIHSGHKLIKIEKLHELIQSKLKEYKSYEEDEKKNSELYNKYEKIQMNNIEQFRQKLTSELNEKINQYKEKS